MRWVVVALCLCVVAAGLGPARPVMAAERLDQENLIADGITEPLFHTQPRNQFWFQTFQPSMTGDLTSIRFGIGSNTAASVTVEVFEVVIVDNEIPRNVLASATATAPAGPCDPNNLVTFTFAEPAEVIAGKEYFFAVYTNENTTNVCSSSGDRYADGVAGYMFNNGLVSPDPPLDPNAESVVLFVELGLDYIFQTFVDPNDAVLIDNLMAAVNDVSIGGPKTASESIRRSMVTMVALAEAAEARGSNSISCLMLTRFELEVRSQVSKRRISRADGAELIDRSSLIRSELGCGLAR